MVERLRALLERPLDRRLARAVVVLAFAVTIGFAAVAALAGTAGRQTGQRSQAGEAPGVATASAGPAIPPPTLPRSGPRPAHPLQDPQDRPGTAAARRADRELASHRALQHVPYRRGDIAIALVGARDGRAVLAVRSRTVPAARRGWAAFLRRYGDAGTAYLPIFRAKGGRRG